MRDIDSSRAAAIVRLGLAGVCLLCLGWGAVQWRLGSGLHPDSVTYLDPAENLARGRGLVHSWAYWDPVYEAGHLPTSSTLWPPGYSLVIAGLILLGMDPTTAARLISVASFSLLPLPIHALFGRLLPPAPALTGTLLAVLLPPLPFFAAAALTEMPFALLATLSLAFTVRAWEAASPRQAAFCWTVASVAAGVAFLFRYVGLACLAGVVLAAAASRARKGRAVPRLAPVLAAVPGGLMCLAVFARNWTIMGTPGQPLPKGNVFWPNLGRSLRALAGEIIGSKELLGPGLSLVRPLEVVLLAGLVVLALLSVAETVRTARSDRRALPQAVGASAMIGLFLVLALGLTLVSLARWGGQVLEARYVAVYLPWVQVLLIGWALRGSPAEASRLAPPPGARPGWPARCGSPARACS